MAQLVYKIQKMYLFIVPCLSKQLAAVAFALQ